MLERAALTAVVEWARRANWTETAPALVVEVTSPGNASKDWVRNLPDHARSGAPHY